MQGLGWTVAIIIGQGRAEGWSDPGWASVTQGAKVLALYAQIKTAMFASLTLTARLDLAIALVASSRLPVEVYFAHVAVRARVKKAYVLQVDVELVEM